jgi:hypothetical protein
MPTTKRGCGARTERGPLAPRSGVQARAGPEVCLEDGCPPSPRCVPQCVQCTLVERQDTPPEWCRPIPRSLSVGRLARRAVAGRVTPRFTAPTVCMLLASLALLSCHCPALPSQTRWRCTRLQVCRNRSSCRELAARAADMATYRFALAQVVEGSHDGMASLRAQCGVGAPPQPLWTASRTPARPCPAEGCDASPRYSDTAT